MAKEAYSPQQAPVLESMIDFTRLEPQSQVYSVLIKGRKPQPGVNARIRAMVGLFVTKVADEMGGGYGGHAEVFTSDGSDDSIPAFIKSIQVPESVSDQLPSHDDAMVMEPLLERSIKYNLPVAVLTIGQSDNGEDIVGLNSILGVTPKTILDDIKIGLKQKQKQPSPRQRDEVSPGIDINVNVNVKAHSSKHVWINGVQII